jgi:hypothetical protein
MPAPANKRAIEKLHQAYNSLNVSLSHLQLSERRLTQAEPSVLIEQIRSSLNTATQRLVAAAEQLRDVETMLNEQANAASDED